MARRFSRFLEIYGKPVVFIKSFVPTGSVLLVKTVDRLERYCKETEVKYR